MTIQLSHAAPLPKRPFILKGTINSQKNVKQPAADLHSLSYQPLLSLSKQPLPLTKGVLSRSQRAAHQ